jgi:acetyltransferase-like isoleucine patch superfamily enzyme
VPGAAVAPLRWTFDALRECWWLGLTHLVCEPYFKSRCRSYGRRLRTGCYLHYVRGRGDILVGDDVTIDGHVTITFAARFSDAPTLAIGDGSSVGHLCRFTVGKRITIGANVQISPESLLYDSPGHPSDPSARGRREPPPDDAVRPIVVGDDVWIGMRSIIGPGVTIGEGSVIAAGSVVLGDVPPNCVMAGNPARKIAVLQRVQSIRPTGVT